MWPFSDAIRPYIQMALYWLGLGRSPQEIMAWAAGSRHHHDLQAMAQAIPEAGRSGYVAEFIRTHDPATAFSRLWGWAARGAWYAGYGRAPTTSEREWSYQRPSDYVGLAVEIKGRSLYSGQMRRYEVTVNVPWVRSWQYVQDDLFNWITDPNSDFPGNDTDPLDADTVTIALIGGALVERQQPTRTLP